MDAGGSDAQPRSALQSLVKFGGQDAGAGAGVGVSAVAGPVGGATVGAAVAAALEHAAGEMLNSELMPLGASLVRLLGVSHLPTDDVMKACSALGLVVEPRSGE